MRNGGHTLPPRVQEHLLYLGCFQRDRRSSGSVTLQMYFPRCFGSYRCSFHLSVTRISFSVYLHTFWRYNPMQEKKSRGKRSGLSSLLPQQPTWELVYVMVEKHTFLRVSHSSVKCFSKKKKKKKPGLCRQIMFKSWCPVTQRVDKSLNLSVS